MTLYALVMIAVGMVDGPGAACLTIGTDAGLARESLRVERVRPGSRPVWVPIGSDRGSKVDPKAQIDRLPQTQGKVIRIRPDERPVEIRIGDDRDVIPVP